MDTDMLTFYPRGIRVLLVEDDSRFLKTGSMLLSLLNFKVSTCSSPTSALKVLSKEDKSEDIDVVLVDANKATTCGFDLKAIVERDLRIPVLCFLSQNHRSSGAEADALLRTLDLASFILKKPLDGDDVCNLWRDIAWRKCCLKYRRTGGAASDVGQSSNGHLLPPWAGLSPLDDDGEEEERVHFREIRGVRGGRKRKSVISNPGSSASGGSVPPMPGNLEQTDVAGQEMAQPVAKPPMWKSRSKKAKKNGEGIEDDGDDDVVEPQPPQPKHSLFVQSVLQTLDVPPYNPIFANAADRGGNVISFSGAGNTTARAPTPTPPPAVFSTPAPTAPAPLPANRAPPPMVHQKQQMTQTGNIAPPAAAKTMSTAVTNKEATLSKLLLGAFGPFPYQGPLPPHTVQHDMFAPLLNIASTNNQQPPTIGAGDLFTTGAVADEEITEFGDDATHEAGGDFGNTASTLMQSLQLGGPAQDDEDDEVAGMMAMYTAADPHLLVPQQAGDDVAAMYYNNNDNAAMFYNDNNGDEPSSVAAPDHEVLGLAYDGNGPEMADGAFDGNAAAGFVAPQGVGMEPNVNQLATGDDDPAAMFASEGNEEDYSFPLEALMGTDDMPMHDAGLAGHQASDATEGASDVDAAGMYLNGGEDGMENWGVWPVDGTAMFDDMLMNDDGSDMLAYYMNNDSEY